MARCTGLLFIGVGAYVLTTRFFGDGFGLTVLAAAVLLALLCLNDANRRFVCPRCRKPILRSVFEGAKWFDPRNQMWEMRLLVFGPSKPDYCPRCKHRLN